MCALGVSESSVLHSTLTSGIRFVAIHKLLFGKRYKLSSGNLIATFQGTGRAETPTRTTMALTPDALGCVQMLPARDFWEGSVLSGVLHCQCDSASLGRLPAFPLLTPTPAIQHRELVLGPIPEVVDTSFPSVA